MAGRQLLLLHLLFLLLVTKATGFGVWGSSRRYGGTHRPGWAWTHGTTTIGHRTQLNSHQFVMYDCHRDIFCISAKSHHIVSSPRSMLFRPLHRRNYGGKKGLFNFFGLSDNTVDNPSAPSSLDSVDNVLISVRRSDSSDLPAGWAQDWQPLVPDIVDSTPTQKLSVEWPDQVTVEAGNVIEVALHRTLSGTLCSMLLSLEPRWVQ